MRTTSGVRSKGLQTVGPGAGPGGPIALTALLIAASGAFATAQPLVYRVELERPGASQISVRLSLPGDPAGPMLLVMPRAVPMGYSQQPYDRYVEGVEARGPDGAPLPVERQEGPRWRLGSAGQSVREVEYRVDLERMEREILGASDASRARPEYVGLLGYSAFAYVEGMEGRAARLEIHAPSDWPVFTTLAPRAPPAAGESTGDAADFYELADSQIAMGPALQVRRIEAAVPLYLAAYSEGPVDLGLTGGLLAEAMQALLRYFGEPAPFAHYTALLELLKPLSPDHEYGFSMEHLSSSHYFLAAGTGITEASSAEQRARVRFNFIHHLAHAWIPKRSYGEGYFPFSWELAPVLDTIWLSEGFARFAAIDAWADTLPGAEAAAYRARMLESLRVMLEQTPAFIREMPLVGLSRVASTRYSEDFRTGRTLFARGALLAAELDARIRERSAGRRRLRDVLRYLLVWSARERRGFRVEELPEIVREATGVETGDVWERWLR